jgi:hypothetical protein
MGWQNETSCKVGMYSNWCIPLEKWEHELTEEEEDKYIMDLPDDQHEAVWKEDLTLQEVIWERPSDLRIARKRVKETKELMERCKGSEHWDTWVPDAVKMANALVQNLSEEDQAQVLSTFGTLTLEGS